MTKGRGEVETEERCDICGSPMLLVRCKLFCRVCGYTRDCEDP